VTEAGGPFVEDLRLSLRKRQKAIKHRLRAFDIERLVDRSDERALHGLGIDCTILAPRTMVRLEAWDNRWVWFDARQGSKEGWRWFYTHEGRMFGDDGGRRLVGALEASFGAAQDAVHSGRMTFAAIWEPLLAQGPEEMSLAR